MITLKQIIQATPAPIKGRAQNQCYGQQYWPGGKPKPVAPLTPEQEAKVDKRKTPPGYKRDRNGLYQEWIYKVKCTDGWRTTQLKLYDGKQPNSRAWCWCNCPYFKYHCEVALAHRGSSSVINSNGANPVFTNPKMQPRVCKHLYLAIIRVLKDRVKKP